MKRKIVYGMLALAVLGLLMLGGCYIHPTSNCNEGDDTRCSTSETCQQYWEEFKYSYWRCTKITPCDLDRFLVICNKGKIASKDSRGIVLFGELHSCFNEMQLQQNPECTKI